MVLDEEKTYGRSKVSKITSSFGAVEHISILELETELMRRIFQTAKSNLVLTNAYRLLSQMFS